MAGEPDFREAIALERSLRWEDALRAYDRLAAGPLAERSRIDLSLRRANVLMELGRMKEARVELDACIEAAKALGDTNLLARTLLGAGVYAGNAGDFARAEPFLQRALELSTSNAGSEERVTAGWALLSLGGVYGRTGRLDRAFVTLQEARERLAIAGEWVGVAAAWETQAQLRRAIGDEERWRDDLAEAVLLYRREGMGEKAERLQGLLGRKLV